MCVFHVIIVQNECVYNYMKEYTSTYLSPLHWLRFKNTLKTNIISKISPENCIFPRKTTQIFKIMINGSGEIDILWKLYFNLSTATGLIFTKYKSKHVIIELKRLDCFSVNLE